MDIMASLLESYRLFKRNFFPPSSVEEADMNNIDLHLIFNNADMYCQPMIEIVNTVKQMIPATLVFTGMNVVTGAGRLVSSHRIKHNNYDVKPSHQ